MNSKPQAPPPEEKKSPLELARRRALYRALHRGTREMDFLLGRFARAEVAGMDMDELAILERLMARPETMLEKLLSPACKTMAESEECAFELDPDNEMAAMAPQTAPHLDAGELAMAARIRAFHRNQRRR